jgi:sugar porter (SP) family MFS transporter
MATPSNRNLYFAAAVACLTAGLFGYSVGFIGGEIVLPSFLSNFQLDGMSPGELASARSATVSAWIAGALFGVPIGMPVCSKFGKRLCLQFAAVLYVLGAVLQLFSLGSLLLFDIGRCINGMGVGAGTLASPIYISEISTAADRGMLMSGYQVFIQSGALLGFWIAYICQALLPESKLQWQLPVAVQLIAGAILLGGCFLIPESPRYLASQQQYRAMQESLSWLRRRHISDPELVAETVEIEAAADLSEKLKQHSLFDELGKKDVRRRLGVGIGLMVAQNMAGLNAINYYAPVIFMSAGFTSISASLFLAGVFGLVKLVSALAFTFKFVFIKGNRFWLMLGSGVCGAAMLVLAYCVRASPPADEAHETAITFVGILSVLMVYLFTFFFTVSLGPISWNVCAEIFPLHINSTCCAITTCTQWAFQVVVAAITPPLLATVGWMTYVVFAFFCIAALVWIGLFVPETRGLGVGKPMDELFGAAHLADDDEVIEEVSETTALLVHDRRRRSSLAALT